MQPPRKLATAEDLAAFGDDVRREVLGGDIVVAPPPVADHGRTQSALSRHVGGPFDFDGQPGGWWIASEVDIELARHDVVRPDLSGWRRARVPELPREWPAKIRPDWVCEIVSPSNEAHDRVHKAALYARSEIPYFWLVSPAARVLEAFRLEAGAWLRLGAWDGTSAARVPPFDAIELPLDRLFLPREP
jgi:Uma2 family endonuclease